MYNKLKSSTKNSSAIFLAIVLIAGTIALSSPSFMTGVEAQPQTYYDGNDNRHDSYGPTPEYPFKYTGSNTYEPITGGYGNDNSYDNKESYETNSYEPTTKSYGNDNNYQKNYENDNNYDKSQYQSSYKPDYKPAYPSYGKDDRDKAKDSKSVSINKIKCINNNVNINGNNAGNVSIGNKGQGYLGGYSSDDSGGYDGSEGYGKQGKGFDCIINNNNNNIAGGGNQTTPPKATLNVTKNVTCTYVFGGVVPELACGLLEDRITENQFLIEVTDDNPVPSQFPGSESGTIVTLGAGNYVVSEIPDVAAIQADIDYLVQQFEGQSGGTEYTITPQVSFTGDCTDVNPNNPQSTEATGTIGEGESQTCNIENHFTITAIP